MGLFLGLERFFGLYFRSVFVLFLFFWLCLEGLVVFGGFGCLGGFSVEFLGVRLLSTKEFNF